jgi:hypothetical protein
MSGGGVALEWRFCGQMDLVVVLRGGKRLVFWFVLFSGSSEMMMKDTTMA